MKKTALSTLMLVCLIPIYIITGEDIHDITLLENFIYVEGGRFNMGSPLNESGRDNDETLHWVRVSDFAISKYEVTQELYEEVTGRNPSRFKGNHLPVESVSWYGAVEFCNKLSKREGLTPAYRINGTNVTWNKNSNGYRLPTEAEWEYAARGGADSRGYTFSGSDIVEEVAKYAGNIDEETGTKPVGGKKANELGLYDMSGNVWEWCWDWYGEYPSGSQTDPTGTSSGSCRILRGGCWIQDAKICRVASRDWHWPNYSNDYLGFRLVFSTQ